MCNPRQAQQGYYNQMEYHLLLLVRMLSTLFYILPVLIILSRPLLTFSRGIPDHPGVELPDDKRRRNLCTPLCTQWHDSSVHKPEHEPGMTLLVPQSHFHFDVTDPTRTRGLISPFDASDEHVRFPTTSAFLDAIIDTMFEPVDGVSHLDFRTSYLPVFLSCLCELVQRG
jgi:hypothetical protein